jgi:hypothetical protein
MESYRNFESGGDTPPANQFNRLGDEAMISMNPREPGGSRPPGHTAGHLPDVQITGGDTNVRVPVTNNVEVTNEVKSAAAATSSAQGGRGGNAQGGEGGRGGEGGKGGESQVSIDNSDRSKFTDKSIFWAPYREATQAVPPGTMGGRLDVTLPSGKVDYSIYGPQSSSAFNLNLDLALPGSGFGAGVGIGTTHTGEAPPEVRTAVTNMDQRAGAALNHILEKDR